MKVFLVYTVISLNYFYSDSMLLPINLESSSPRSNDPPDAVAPLSTSPDTARENSDEQNVEDYAIPEEKMKKEDSTTKQPCAIVVLSNIQNPGMQSLIRKYRYDSNGILIPSSVKYFLKMPSAGRDTPVLVPLHDKAFSPIGGFVRYYKEVPPIPPSW